MKSPNPYQTFLASQPVIDLASERLPDDEAFAAFLEAVQDRNKRAEKTHGHLSESLSWFLFEEIGWPEGAGYIYDQRIEGRTYLHYLRMLRRPTTTGVIHERLENRRKHWKKPTKPEFIAAHKLLLKILDQHPPQPTCP